MRVPALAVILLLAPMALLAGNNNADSCDIGVTPAATLLLPYFEVDVAPPGSSTVNTIFTITNTSRYPQIAHVTIWTDWAFPVLNFNLFLTGYDVQGVSLYDLLVDGRIPSGEGMAVPPGKASGDVLSPPADNTANPNFVHSGERSVSATCASIPRTIPADILGAVRNALTVGKGFVSSAASCGVGQVGFNHGTHAVGYVTVDVVSYCTTKFATDADGSYVSGPAAPLLFDNVLLGDSQRLSPPPSGAGSGTFDGVGDSMVHIRAIPEGGLSGAAGGTTVNTNLPFTFYDRYTPSGSRAADRRQPLPSVWLVRYIQGGTSHFETALSVWREGVTTGLPICTQSETASFQNGAVANNGAIDIPRLIIRFDEHENSTGLTITSCPGLCVPPVFSLPASSRVLTTSSSTFPAMTGTDVGGWMYLNLSSDGATNRFGSPQCDGKLSAQREGFGVNPCGARMTTQNWVTNSIYGAGHLAAELDAAWLGNGCTPETPFPAPPSIDRALVCPDGTPPANCGAGTKPANPNP